MTEINVWWDPSDDITTRLVEELGGEDVINEAIGAVLPKRRVKLRTLTPGQSGSVVFHAAPTRIQNGRSVPEVEGVLKVGPAHLLADEEERYESWVKHILEDPGHFAQLDIPDKLKETAKAQPNAICALHYRHVGSTTLGEYLIDRIKCKDLTSACAAIDNLLMILRPWQEIMDPITDKRLTEDDIYSFGDDPFDVFEKVCINLNNLIKDSRDHIPESSFGKIRLLWHPLSLVPERMLTTIVHGDLHTDNIMADRKGKLTLIDFGAVGKGHFLRDITILEAHIVLRVLAPLGEEITPKHHEYLLQLRKLYNPNVLLNPCSQGERCSIQAIVNRLRRYAFFCLMNGHTEYIPQYVLGVLRHAIRISTRSEELGIGQKWVIAHAVCAIRDCLSIEKEHLCIAGGDSANLTFEFLDFPEGRWYANPHVELPRTAIAKFDGWDSLARDLLTSSQLDFLGLVPLPLIYTLLNRADKTGGFCNLRQIRYITFPQPNRTDGYYNSSGWKFSLTGMRNLVNQVSGSPVAIQSFAYSSNYVNANCLIRSRRHDKSTGLYEIALMHKQMESSYTSYIITEITDSDECVEKLVNEIAFNAKPIIIREVDCKRYKTTTKPEEPVFQPAIASKLATYGDPMPRSALRPIAICILRYDGPDGRQVLVTVRSPLVDNDNFDRYSFLSSRILAEDICSVYKVKLFFTGDPDEEFRTLWHSIGSPKKFELEEDVFITAARRCIYGATLLDLKAERFTYHGMHVLDAEENDVQLGYAVLTADLEIMEVNSALRAGKNMFDGVIQLLHLIDVSKFLDGTLPVNKFTQERQEWLSSTCL